jgi:transposase
VIDTTQLNQLDAPQLREMVRSLMGSVAAKDREIAFKQATIDKITHEMAVLKRLKFAARSEHFNAEQRSLIEETIDADLAALQTELDKVRASEKDTGEKKHPKREALPAHLLRREVHHEPENTTCGCGCALKRIGEDVAEKLDYAPGVFTVERHVRGKWVCAKCETLVQAPVAPHIIDKGIPTAELLAQVLVAKFLDHLPLYRQERIFERAGLAIARSTLAQWAGQCGAQLQPLVDALTAELLKHDVLHADEMPVAMLKPGNGKTHRAYLWSYCTTSYNETKAVVFDFAESRAGLHAREFLGLPSDHGWRGKLVCDDYCSSACPHSPPVASTSCCRIAGSRRLPPADRTPVVKTGSPDAYRGPVEHVGHVGHPQLVRAIGVDLALDQIGRRELPLISPRRQQEASAPADAADGVGTHQPRHTLAVDLHTLIDQFGSFPRHAIRGIRLGMNCANALDQYGVAYRALGRGSVEPRVVAAGRDLKHAADPVHGNFGLVRVHEFVDPIDVFSPLPANQAVASAKMSRSCLSRRFSRRSRANSLRSALVKTSLPLSAAACATQVDMLWAVQPSQTSTPHWTTSARCDLRKTRTGPSRTKPRNRAAMEYVEQGQAYSASLRTWV